MMFDTSKVFTVFNCDEVKVGSKGYFADTKVTLIHRVQSDNKDCCGVLENIYDDDYAFLLDDCARYRYFYLVEEPKEKVKRPCTREELLEMLKKQELPMLKCNLNSINYSVTEIANTSCFIYERGGCTYQELCENYTLIDGTELWVEE